MSAKMVGRFPSNWLAKIQLITVKPFFKEQPKKGNTVGSRVNL